MKTIKILFVCHGNICRSPMAEYVMQDLINKEGIAHLFTIASAATSREEIGCDAHHGTIQKMREKGIPTWHRQARQMTKEDYTFYDYIILMDENNWRNAMRIIGVDTEAKVFKAMYFAHYAEKGLASFKSQETVSERERRIPRDVKDPWYTGDFEATYQDILACCDGLLKTLSIKQNPD